MNAWLTLVCKIKKEKGCSLKEAMVFAAKIYKKK